MQADSLIRTILRSTMMVECKVHVGDGVGVRGDSAHTDASETNIRVVPTSIPQRAYSVYVYGYVYLL